MTRVLTYGTFDLIHFGHLKLLKTCKNLGDELIVGVSSDEFNKIKGKKSVMNFEERKHLIENIKFVDKVIKEDNWEQKVEDIKKYKIDIFVIGEDWKGKFDYLNKYCKVIYLPRTKGISTTLLKRLMTTEGIGEEESIVI